MPPDAPGTSLVERFDAAYRRLRSDPTAPGDTSSIGQFVDALARAAIAADTNRARGERPGQIRQFLHTKLSDRRNRTLEPEVAASPPSSFVERAIDQHLGPIWRSTTLWHERYRGEERNAFGLADLAMSHDIQAVTTQASADLDVAGAIAGSVIGHRLRHLAAVELGKVTRSVEALVADAQPGSITRHRLNRAMSSTVGMDGLQLATAVRELDRALEETRHRAFGNDDEAYTILTTMAFLRTSRMPDSTVRPLRQSVLRKLLAGDLQGAVGQIRSTAERNPTWFTVRGLEGLGIDIGEFTVEVPEGATIGRPASATSSTADLAWLSRAGGQVWLDPEQGHLVSIADQIPLDGDRQVHLAVRPVRTDIDPGDAVGSLVPWGDVRDRQQTNARGLRQQVAHLVPLMDAVTAMRAASAPFDDRDRVRILSALVDRGDIVLPPDRVRAEVADELQRRTAQDLRRAALRGGQPDGPTSARRRTSNSTNRSALARYQGHLLSGVDEHGPWIGVLERPVGAVPRTTHLRRARRLGTVEVPDAATEPSTVALWGERVPIDLSDHRLLDDVASGAVRDHGPLDAAYLRSMEQGTTYAVDLPDVSPRPGSPTELLGSSVPAEAMEVLAPAPRLPLRPGAARRPSPPERSTRSNFRGIAP